MADLTANDMRPVLVPNLIRGADDFIAGRVDVTPSRRDRARWPKPTPRSAAALCGAGYRAGRSRRHAEAFPDILSGAGQSRAEPRRHPRADQVDAFYYTIMANADLPPERVKQIVADPCRQQGCACAGASAVPRVQLRSTCIASTTCPIMRARSPSIGSAASSRASRPREYRRKARCRGACRWPRRRTADRHLYAHLSGCRSSRRCRRPHRSWKISAKGCDRSKSCSTSMSGSAKWTNMAITGRSSRCPTRRSRTSPRAAPRSSLPASPMISMAELCRRHPDRFPAFAAALALTDIDGSLKEAKRAIDDLGARGVQIFTNIAGEPLDDPKFAPLFALMARIRPADLAAPGADRRHARLSFGEKITLRTVVVLRLALRHFGRHGRGWFFPDCSTGTPASRSSRIIAAA